MLTAFPLASIFSVPDLILLGLLILLLLGPKAGRTLGSIGRTVLNLKREVDETKAGIQQGVRREIESALHGPAKGNAQPPELPRT